MALVKFIAGKRSVEEYDVLIKNGMVVDGTQSPRYQANVGKTADVIIYDLENLEVLPVEVAHDLPGGEWRRIQRARGYRAVFVNGEFTLEDDKVADGRSGQMLRSL